MSYQATVFKVMIASPSDITSERVIAREIIHEWNVVNADSRKIVLLPISWESHTSPAMGERPQSIINKQILKDCDLLIGIFWTRLGSPTDEYDSGTVEEIEEHIKAGKPVMLYFSKIPIYPDSVDKEQYDNLKYFMESCKKRGLFETYVNINDFKSKLYRQIQLKLNNDEYFTKGSMLEESDHIITSTTPDLPTLSREAQILLKEASRDPQGSIYRFPQTGGLLILSNKKQFITDKIPRTIALWEGVIEELERNELIETKGSTRTSFSLTRKGFQISDQIDL
ncbi:MAG: DUF4062 domain-containing protein [Proteobacteria bacterium]|nr:DUF4062 domain-containing protein [Pseudomonadota bacterium]